MIRCHNDNCIDAFVGWELGFSFEHSRPRRVGACDAQLRGGLLAFGEIARKSPCGQGVEAVDARGDAVNVSNEGSRSSTNHSVCKCFHE